MRSSVTTALRDERSTLYLGAALAELLLQGLERSGDRALCIHLEGDLGAGKTTLTRGVLRAMNHAGVVKSPTYTLVEGYKIRSCETRHEVTLRTEDDCALSEDADARPVTAKSARVTKDTDVYHFDLYRLTDPEELELMGIRDYFEGRALCLVEWPDKGDGYLPAADLTVRICHEINGRTVTLSSDLFTRGELESALRAAER